MNGFVEELPNLPKARFGHACAPIPTPGNTGQVTISLFYSPVLSPVSSPVLSPVFHLFYNLSHHPVHPPLLQTFIVAGGSFGEREYTSSVVSLLPGATAWTEKRSLPRALFVPRASVVGGKMWLVGGQTKYQGFRDEVTITSKR